MMPIQDNMILPIIDLIVRSRFKEVNAKESYLLLQRYYPETSLKEIKTRLTNDGSEFLWENTIRQAVMRGKIKKDFKYLLYPSKRDVYKVNAKGLAFYKNNMKYWSPRYRAGDQKKSQLDLINPIVISEIKPIDKKDAYKMRFLKELSSLHCYRSEYFHQYLISKLWDVYNIIMTPMSHDRGIDIWGQANAGGFLVPLTYQVRNKSSTIGRPELQQYVGALKDGTSTDRYYEKLESKGIFLPKNLNTTHRNLDFATFFSTTKYSKFAIQFSSIGALQLYGPDEVRVLCESKEVGVKKIGKDENGNDEFEVDYDFFDDIRTRFQGSRKLEGFDKELAEQVFNIRKKW